MPGSFTALSIYSLPRFLCALHHLRSTSIGAKRAFSTSYSDRTITSLRPTCITSKSLSHNQAAASVPEIELKRGPQKLWRRYQSTESSVTEHTPSSKRRKWAPKKEPLYKRDSAKRRKATPNDEAPRKLEPWAIQKQALKEKFKEGWDPRRKLSPDAMDGVRQLHKSDPVKFSTPVLAEHFKVSPEAIRRILKSKWRASEDELKKKQERWERREARIWNQMAELGLRPQRQEFASLSDAEALKDESEREDPAPKNDK